MTTYYSDEKAVNLNECDDLDSLAISVAFGYEGKRPQVLKQLNEMYDRTVELKIETVSVPAWTKTFGQYLSEDVLRHLIAISWDDVTSIFEFIDKIRKNFSLDYHFLIMRVAAEGICRFGRGFDDDGIARIAKLMIMANQDGFKLDYQRLLRGCTRSYIDNQKVAKFIKQMGAEFKFDFSELLACDSEMNFDHIDDLRQILGWAKEADQKIEIDCQKLLETCISKKDCLLVEFYLDQAKSRNQTINYAKLLELTTCPDIIDVLEAFKPEAYQMPIYSESLEINLKTVQFNDLIQCCYMTTAIDHVVYQGKNYYPRSNLWTAGTDCERPEHDPDIECEGYDNKCNAPSTIYPSEQRASRGIEYVLSYDPSAIQYCWNHGPEFADFELIRQIMHADWKQVTLTGITTLTLMNTNGFNYDHRGSDHCQLEMDFDPDQELTCPVTLDQLFDALYRIKSHKWDHHYEMHWSCKTSLSKDDQSLDVTLMFDHGS